MAANIKATKEITYSWEGKDKKGKNQGRAGQFGIAADVRLVPGAGKRM